MWGTYFYMKKKALLYVYLQLELSTAFCTLKQSADVLIRLMESDIVRKVYLAFFDGKTQLWN